MSLKFGTSGVRGLVTEMTDRECYLYSKSFLRYTKERSDTRTVSLAGDLRSSTPRIMKAVAFAIREEGLELDFCGTVGTPVVAYQGMRNTRPSIMVTGSHIPDDRNGIKFNMPWGEVLKEDETRISALYTALKGENTTADTPFGKDDNLLPDRIPELGAPNADALAAYRARYIEFFPEKCLAGRRIVVYEHSSVSRDVLAELLEALGATVVRVGRSDTFVPVDTEAVQDADQLAAWVQEHGADALVTTDGDGDRPLAVDEQGQVIRGDVLGILVAAFLGADSVCAPVSCNTALEKCGRFQSVTRTRIGSPYVIAAMDKAVEAGAGTIVGYEANGGFLTATDIVSPDTSATVPALPTRDAVLPLLCLLRSAADTCLSALVAALPQRFTFSGLLREFPSELGKQIVHQAEQEPESFARTFFTDTFGDAASFDFTDGARITFDSGDVVHLRPSGNAPEFRCYTEAETADRAKTNSESALHIVRDRIRPHHEHNLQTH